MPLISIIICSNKNGDLPTSTSCHALHPLSHSVHLSFFLPCSTSPPLHLSLQYKHPEGSDWERRALYAGYKELMEEVQEVEFEIPEVEYEFGQDINLEVS